MFRRIDDAMVSWLLHDAPWWKFWYPQTGERGSLAFGAVILLASMALDFTCGTQAACRCLLVLFICVMAPLVYGVTAIFRVIRRRGIVP